jgi:hypothetical protein
MHATDYVAVIKKQWKDMMRDWPLSTYLADIMPYDMLALKNEIMCALRE